MNFQQAQQQFQHLEALRNAGQIDPSQYRAGIDALQVVDSNGVHWKIQERTGAWFYFWNGRWQPGSPSGQAAVPQAAAQPKKRFSSIAIGLLLAFVGVAACVAVGLGAYLLYPRGTDQPAGFADLAATQTAMAQDQPASPQAQPTQLPVKLILKQLSETSVNADGASVTDANGVSVQVPATALQGDSGSGKAVVTTYQMQGGLATALSKNFSIDSPVYAVEAQGQQDSSGRATLVFPAANPASRLVQIVDDRYLIPVKTQPVDGKLTFQARMGPADSKDLKPSGSFRFDGSLRFAVITPKKARVPGIVAVSARSESAPGFDCTVISDIGVSPCHANEAQTVKVLWDESLSFSHTQAYQVAKEAEKWMAVYASKDIGFKNADLSAYWMAMEIVVEAGSGDPQYNPKNGVIYMPVDFAKSIGSGAGSSALLHEMGHWIQDEAYKMCWAGLKSVVGFASNQWWLDVAAENMVMLAKPDYIKDNIATYGVITSPSNGLVWQMAINQWPADFYAQAQLVKVFMCDDGACPLSQKSFVEAINNGTYPYNDEGAISKVGANLEDYARYLVGTKPQKTNTTISLAGVSDSGAVGEVLQVTKRNGQLLAYLGSQGRKPQVDVKKEGGFDSLVFSAPLERDGVYPITITSREGYVGLPVMLTVEAGIPLVYRLDGGEVKTHSGDKPLILGPISANLGYKEVRLAAYSSASGMTFKGSLKVIDVKGAWTIQSTSTDKPVSNGVVCDNPPKDGVDNLYQMLPLYGNIGIALGDFTPSASADRLDWAMLSKRVPPDTKPDEFSQNFSMQITPEDITIKGMLDVPQKDSFVPEPGQAAAGLGGLWLGVLGLVGGAGRGKYWTRKKSKLLAIGLILGLMALLLGGCLGFYGSSQMEIKITKMEAANGNTDATWNLNTQPVPDTLPIWNITQATGTYQVNSTTVTDTTPNLLSDKKIYTYNHCKGTIVYNLKGGIYPDVTIISK